MLEQRDGEVALTDNPEANPNDAKLAYIDGIASP